MFVGQLFRQLCVEPLMLQKKLFLHATIKLFVKQNIALVGQVMVASGVSHRFVQALFKVERFSLMKFL